MSAIKTYLGCGNEMISLCKSLHMQLVEDDWMTCLKSIESKRNLSGLDSLFILKALIPSVLSVQALRNLVQLFVRKVSSLMEELNISKNESMAKQTLKIVNDFWSLVSTQHVVITQQVFGSYSPHFFDVLPSLASVYVDVFIAVHSTKNTIDKASKRLYSWLMFELNERCIKTALLEVYECTEVGSRLLLPVLRKLLSKPPDHTSNLDYLLHFVLLKRWTFVCTELFDLFQTSLSIKAPRDFLNWLTQYWPKAVEYFPSDKSLKGRRVSELMLELNQAAVEDLIDVFSRCLWSKEQVFEVEEGFDEKIQVKQVVKLERIGEFVNDKREKIHSAEHTQSVKKKRKLHDDKNSTLLFDDSSQRLNESDIFELVDDSSQRLNKSDIIELVNDSIYIEKSNRETQIRESRRGKKERTITVSDSESEVIMHDLEYEEHVVMNGLISNSEFTDLSKIGKNEPEIIIIDGTKDQIFNNENSVCSITDEDEQVEGLPKSVYTEFELTEKSKLEARKLFNKIIDYNKKDAQPLNEKKLFGLDPDLMSNSDEEITVDPSYSSPFSSNLKRSKFESPNLKVARAHKLESPNLKAASARKLESPNLKVASARKLESPNLKAASARKLESPNLKVASANKVESPNPNAASPSKLELPNLKVASPKKSPNLKVASPSKFKSPNLKVTSPSKFKSPKQKVTSPSNFKSPNLKLTSPSKFKSPNLKVASPTKLKSPVLQNSVIDLTVHQSAEFESKENKSKPRRIKDQKLHEFDRAVCDKNSMPGNIVDDEDNISGNIVNVDKDRFEHQKTTEFQVGLILSEFRKSMQNERKLASNDRTDMSLCLKTSLRTKSESLTQTGNNLRDNELSTWLRKSPRRLLKRHLTSESEVMKDDGEHETNSGLTIFPEQTPTIKDIKSSGRNYASVKELKATDVFGAPMKTYSKKDRLISKTSNTLSGLALELSSSQTCEEPQQSRYFLRTNCTHRMNNSEMCPSCSPEIISPKKLSHSQ